jgi:hypothetical protein
MLENDQTLSAMAEILARSADYRVLRRLVPRTRCPVAPRRQQSFLTSIHRRSHKRCADPSRTYAASI